MPKQKAKRGARRQEHTFSQEEWLVILLLIFVYPVGLILMWIWHLWPGKVRWLVTLPALLFILVFLFAFIGVLVP
jgi:NADH:ubiquinone oxidoreductase subunit 3 (subunit A)